MPRGSWCLWPASGRCSFIGWCLAQPQSRRRQRPRRREFEMAKTSAAEETRAILSSCHAILENDHFVYCSGDHGNGWIDKDAVFPHTQHLERLGDLLAEAVRHLQPEVVCGPATGGL